MASTATTPRTPRTPRAFPATALPTQSPDFAPAEAASGQAAPASDWLQPQSVPATPETTKSGGNAGPSVPEQGRAVWHSPPSTPQEQMQMSEGLSLQTNQGSLSAPAKMYGLPSAEDIDALCDMDNPSHHRSQGMPSNVRLHDNAAYQPINMQHALAPVATTLPPAAVQDDVIEGPSVSGFHSTYTNDMAAPQHSSSQFKRTLSGHSRQSFPPNRPELPEPSMPYLQGSRLQSECDSSAFDEGASSTLIHSISNEEQNMHDLLEDDNDDIFYNVMDTQQHGSDMGEVSHRAQQQLNTMELHGILGQHGYKLPELAGDQEEEEESDGDDGVGDEDLDDPDVDDDDEDDEESNKDIFKVCIHLVGKHLVGKLIVGKVKKQVASAQAMCLCLRLSVVNCCIQIIPQLDTACQPQLYVKCASAMCQPQQVQNLWQEQIVLSLPLFEAKMQLFTGLFPF